MREAEKLLADGNLRASLERLNALKAQRVPTAGVDLLRAKYFLSQKQKLAAIEALKEELRFFPDNAEAASMLGELSPARKKTEVPGDAEFRDLYTRARPYTMVGAARLWSLFSRAKEICERDLPGNFVECGVAAGGSSALLATAIARYSKRSRRLFACDTFEGMPEASEFDTHRGQTAGQVGWGAGTCAAPVESLRQICRQLSVEHLVEPLPGLFGDTLPANRSRLGEIAVLHMDGDWYSSTRDVLENLYEQVVPGGFIQIDDYGHWEGCRRAVTEFETKLGAPFQLQPIDESGVWMTK